MQPYTLSLKLPKQRTKERAFTTAPGSDRHAEEKTQDESRHNQHKPTHFCCFRKRCHDGVTTTKFGYIDVTITAKRSSP